MKDRMIVVKMKKTFRPKLIAFKTHLRKLRAINGVKAQMQMQKLQRNKIWDLQVMNINLKLKTNPRYWKKKKSLKYNVKEALLNRLKKVLNLSIWMLRKLQNRNKNRRTMWSVPRVEVVSPLMNAPQKVLYKTFNHST